MISGDDASRIALEVQKGQLESADDTPEQKAYRVQVKKEIDEIHAKGGIVDIPKEWL